MSLDIDICRICLQNGANTSIFNINGSEQFYIQIMSCAQVEITIDDGLPNALCDNCIMNLNTSYNFKHLCESSDLRLRNLLSQHLDIKVVPEIIEDDQRLVLSHYIMKGDDRLQQDLDFEDINVIKINYCNENDINEIHDQPPIEVPNEKQKSKKPRKTIRPRKKKIKVKEKAPDKVIYRCDKCKTNFEGQDLLDEHRKICNVEPEVLECKVCHKIFKDKYILNRHSKLHNEAKPAKLKRHMCDLCGHTFYDRYGLNMHKRSHFGHRPFVCPVCGHGFSQQSNMERHVKAKHEKVKPFQCSICFKVFAYSYVLTEHHKVHTGEKDFECGVCGRKFAKKFALNRHMVTHTLERPFKCKLCEKSYTQSNDLKAHVRRTHEKEVPNIQMESIDIQAHINSYPFMECNAIIEEKEIVHYQTALDNGCLNEINIEN